MSQSFAGGPSAHWARLKNAFFYSLNGLRAAWAHEAAFRLETALAAALIPLGLWLGGSRAEKAALCASVIFVIVVEIVNSALEAVVDRVSLERHELAGRAKDLGSAAVMIASLCCALTWAICLWP